MSEQDNQSENGENKHDPELECELDGVPEQFLDDGDDKEEGDSLGDTLAQLKTELEEAKQQVLYARADTQNVRRRLEREKDEARAYASTGFARDILSVADNLSRALAAVPDDMREHNKLEGLIAGIEATQRELDKVFGQHGISRIAAMGMPLDPNQHQAMLEIPTGDAEPGTVIQEMQSGYMIKDRLLRPAMVGVAKKPD